MGGYVLCIAFWFHKYEWVVTKRGRASPHSIPRRHSQTVKRIILISPPPIWIVDFWVGHSEYHTWNQGQADWDMTRGQVHHPITDAAKTARKSPVVFAKHVNLPGRIARILVAAPRKPEARLSQIERTEGARGACTQAIVYSSQWRDRATQDSLTTGAVKLLRGPWDTASVVECTCMALAGYHTRAVEANTDPLRTPLWSTQIYLLLSYGPLRRTNDNLNLEFRESPLVRAMVTRLDTLYCTPKFCGGLVPANLKRLQMVFSRTILDSC